MLQDFSENELIASARAGEEDALTRLILQLLPRVEAAAAGFATAGATRADLVQEGLLGAVNAVFTYDPEKGAQFSTYAERCIVNSMTSAVRRLNRKKQQPLNRYVPLEDAEHAADETGDPEALLAMRERMDAISFCIEETLTTLERDVLLLHIAGEPYAAIAQALRISEKSVANALCRARRKIREAQDQTA